MQKSVSGGVMAAIIGVVVIVIGIVAWKLVFSGPPAFHPQETDQQKQMEKGRAGMAQKMQQMKRH